MTRKWDEALGQWRDSGKFGGNDNVAAAAGFNALIPTNTRANHDAMMNALKGLDQIAHNHPSASLQRHYATITATKARVAYSVARMRADFPGVDQFDVSTSSSGSYWEIGALRAEGEVIANGYGQSLPPEQSRALSQIQEAFLLHRASNIGDSFIEYVDPQRSIVDLRRAEQWAGPIPQ